MAERLGRDAAGVDLDPVHRDLHHDHVGVGKARREERVPIALPQGAHLGPIVDHGCPADQPDIAIAGAVLIGQGDPRRALDLRHLA